MIGLTNKEIVDYLLNRFPWIFLITSSYVPPERYISCRKNSYHNYTIIISSYFLNTTYRAFISNNKDYCDKFEKWMEDYFLKEENIELNVIVILDQILEIS